MKSINELAIVVNKIIIQYTFLEGKFEKIVKRDEYK